MTFLLILKYLLSFHYEPNTIYRISNKMVLALRVSFESTVIIASQIVRRFVFLSSRRLSPTPAAVFSWVGRQGLLGQAGEVKSMGVSPTKPPSPPTLDPRV